MTSGPSSDSDLDVDPEMIERLDAGEPPRSPEEAQARGPYERLIERVRDLDEIAPPGDWEDRAVARWSQARRKRRLGIGLAIGATTAVGLAAALLLRCGAPDAAGLEVAVLTDDGSTYRGDASVGKVLQTRARVDRAEVDLRLYLDTRLIARCPGSAGCRRDASIVQLDWKLVAPGRYQIVLLSSGSKIPAGHGTVDGDLLEARAAGASIETHPISVAP